MGIEVNRACCFVSGIFLSFSLSCMLKSVKEFFVGVEDGRLVCRAKMGAAPFGSTFENLQQNSLS